MQRSLMTSRKFAPLFWTQFLTAFNDNFLKNTLVFLILFQMSANEGAALVTLAGVILIMPFLLLSAIGGELADKHDKAQIAELLKRCEIAVAALAVVGLAFSSIWILMAALFGFGVVSALFGPIKYGILPDHLERRDLPKANAWIEGGTFIAILAGTIAAAFAFSGRRQCSRLRHDDDGAFGDLLASQPDDPGNRLQGARSQDRHQRHPLQLHLVMEIRSRQAPLAFGADELLVLAGRRLRPVADADAWSTNCSAAPRIVVTAYLDGLCHRRRDRLGDRRPGCASGRIVLLPAPIGTALLAHVRPRSRLEPMGSQSTSHGADAPRLSSPARTRSASRSISPGMAIVRRLHHRADLRRGAGLGARRHAAPASSRAANVLIGALHHRRPAGRRRRSRPWAPPLRRSCSGCSASSISPSPG